MTDNVVVVKNDRDGNDTVIEEGVMAHMCIHSQVRTADCSILLERELVEGRRNDRGPWQQQPALECVPCSLHMSILCLFYLVILGIYQFSFVHC